MLPFLSPFPSNRISLMRALPCAEDRRGFQLDAIIGLLKHALFICCSAGLRTFRVGALRCLRHPLLSRLCARS